MLVALPSLVYIVIMAVLPSGFVSDQAHVYPDDMFYGLKIWFEDIPMNFMSDTDKIIYLTKSMNEKTNEIVGMVGDGKFSYADVSVSGLYSDMVKSYSLAKDQQTRQWISSNVGNDISILQNKTIQYSDMLTGVQNGMLNGIQGTTDDQMHRNSELLGKQIDYLNKLTNNIQLKDYQISGISRF